MKRMLKEELIKTLKERRPGLELDLRGICIRDADLSGIDLHNVNLEKSELVHVCLDGANLAWSKAKRACFQDSSMKGVVLQGADLREADFRKASLAGADFCGANLYGAMFYQADLSGITVDGKTAFFYMCCPQEGAFVAWKVCFDRRIVRLLIPADALRVSGTTREVRCDKARVLSIQSVDGTEEYREAYSYVDENFVYRTGEMVYADNFNPNRFVESGGGIHVWMSRDEAVAYLG